MDTYVSPDERYVVFCSTKPGGQGEDDLYVTFRTASGAWGPPIPFGTEINTAASENRPYVSPDGRYLFYTSTIRGNRDIYWVDAAVIDDLRAGAADDP